MAGCLSKKGRISKRLFSRIDQERHLLNGGEMCSAVKGKLAGEVPEQARLQREIHSKASPIKPFWVRRVRSPLGSSSPWPELYFAGSLLLDFPAVIIERKPEKADLFLKTSPSLVMSRLQPAGRSPGDGKTKALILP